MAQCIAIRYDIDANGEWNEAEKKVCESHAEATEWCESQLGEDQTMEWAETHIGEQGSVEGVEYDEWEHVWEIAGWDGEGVEELQYDDE